MNAAFDTLRRYKREKKLQTAETLQEYPSSLQTTAQDKLEVKKAEVEILSAISRLPRSQALAVLMRVVQGHSYDEIGETLGCSKTTARIHVSRGRAKLTRWLFYLLPAPSVEATL